MSSLVFHV